MFAPYKTETPDAPVKADPFSLDALIAWLRTKDADSKYCFSDNGFCLFAQYALALGIKKPYVTAGAIFENGEFSGRMRKPSGREVLLPGCQDWQTGSTFSRIAVGFPWTFSAALDRALAIRARSAQ